MASYEWGVAGRPGAGSSDRCLEAGRPLPQIERPLPRVERRLTRDIDNKKIAGVCAGFARYLDLDVILVRILWLAVALGTGIGFIAYVIAWIIMPRERTTPVTPAASAPARYGSV